MKLGKKKEAEQDFELNLASIIDCFTVLITYLLVSASFITLGVFEVSTSSTSAETPSSEENSEKKLYLFINLNNDKQISLRTEGAEKINFDFKPLNDGSWNTADLTAQLQTLKSKYNDLDSVLLGAQNEVEYEGLVKIIEAIRPLVPKISLG